MPGPRCDLSNTTPSSLWLCTILCMHNPCGLHLHLLLMLAERQLRGLRGRPPHGLLLPPPLRGLLLLLHLPPGLPKRIPQALASCTSGRLQLQLHMRLSITQALPCTSQRLPCMPPSPLPTTRRPLRQRTSRRAPRLHPRLQRRRLMMDLRMMTDRRMRGVAVLCDGVAMLCDGITTWARGWG